MPKGDMRANRDRAIKIAGGSPPGMRRRGYEDGGEAGDGGTGASAGGVDAGAGQSGNAGDAGVGDGNNMYQQLPPPIPPEPPAAKKDPKDDQPFPYASTVPNWMGGTLVPTPPKIARDGGRARRK